MQIAHMVPSVAATLIIVVFLGHIYIGTIGMRGAYQTMKAGYVDEGWAAEHHRYWYEEAAVAVSRRRAGRTAAEDGVLA